MIVHDRTRLIGLLHNLKDKATAITAVAFFYITPLTATSTPVKSVPSASTTTLTPPVLLSFLKQYIAYAIVLIREIRIIANNPKFTATFITSYQ